MAREDLFAKHPDDVVICATVRTAFTKMNKGGLKDTCVEELLSAVLAAVADRAKLPSKSLVEDVAAGIHVAPGCGHVLSRMALLAAGYPDSTGIFTINRQCMAGLQAVITIANAIRAGEIKVGIAAGAESLSTGRGLAGSFPDALSEKVKAHPRAAECLLTPGQTSDNVATDFGITRAAADEFAAITAQKASAAQKAGTFAEEILPVTVMWKDPTSGEAKEITVSEDELIRHDVTPGSLSMLKPVFNPEGPTTAGNSSPLADGAGAVLLARRSEALKLGLPVLAKYITGAGVGCAPRIMGTANVVAIPKVLAAAGISKADVDIFEIVEGFATGNVYTQRALDIPNEKINPNGGAIPLGHPLAASPVRQIVTALNEAKRRNARIFLTSGCLVTGGGLAAVFVNEQ